MPRITRAGADGRIVVAAGFSTARFLAVKGASGGAVDDFRLVPFAIVSEEEIEEVEDDDEIGAEAPASECGGGTGSTRCPSMGSGLASGRIPPRPDAGWSSLAEFEVREEEGEEDILGR
jgi:hypothetical protein